MSAPVYSSSIYDFSQLNPTGEESALAAFINEFSTNEQAKWRKTVALLQEQLQQLPHLSGSLLLNLETPSLNTRCDAVILYRGLVFVVCLDVDASDYSVEPIEQTHDKALGFKQHHPTCADKFIVPVLLATAAQPQGSAIHVSEDLVADTMCDTGAHLALLIEHFANQYKADEITLKDWGQVS
ncbi:hypothetical protein [Vibrio hepatarius]|uniref:hypothetical protein n=1 Tax=Vibrio hepatarius TaxID=171383 RepID=UPI00142D518E|nr:hypothetical protein [Vibrio hepatarius]NIY82793.1 hypothetical protein [Vibrio hepatarius]